MRGKIGMVLIIVGLIWLVGIAGGDDYMVMNGTYIPFSTLVLRALFPIGLCLAGMILKGVKND